MIHLGVGVSLSVIYDRGGGDFINIFLNYLNQKVSHSGSGVMLTVLYAKGEGGGCCFNIFKNHTTTLFSYYFV